MDPLVLSGRTGLGAPGVPAAPRSPGLTQPHLRLLPGGGHPAWAPRTGALASHPERGEGAPALVALWVSVTGTSRPSSWLS